VCTSGFAIEMLFRREGKARKVALLGSHDAADGQVNGSAKAEALWHVDMETRLGLVTAPLPERETRRDVSEVVCRFASCMRRAICKAPWPICL
jgi:hypothetical protein